MSTVSEPGSLASEFHQELQLKMWKAWGKIVAKYPSLASSEALMVAAVDTTAIKNNLLPRWWGDFKARTATISERMKEWTAGEIWEALSIGVAHSLAPDEASTLGHARDDLLRLIADKLVDACASAAQKHPAKKGARPAAPKQSPEQAASDLLRLLADHELPAQVEDPSVHHCLRQCP